jgi:tetratricopeptide (TPR) repeat protein
MTRTAASTILIYIVLFGLTTIVQAELPKEQIFSFFDQANEAFRQANSLTDKPNQAKKLYEKAILLYENIITDGQIENAKLYYNLANAYFLKEDIGHAILNYRRAEMLDGSDANIQKNLAFARSKTIDKFTLKTEKRVLQTLFFWHYDFPLKTKFALSCIFFAVICIALTVTIWLGRNTPATVTAVIAAILWLALAASVVVEARHLTGAVCGVISADQVVARQGDGQNYPASFKEPLHAGTEFGLLERRPGWLHIELPDDSDCWIPDNSAEVI